MPATFLRPLRILRRIVDVQAALDPLGHTCNGNWSHVRDRAVANSLYLWNHRYSSSAEEDRPVELAGPPEPDESLRREEKSFEPSSGAVSSDVSGDTIKAATAARTANLPEDFVPEMPEVSVFRRTEPSRKERRDVQTLEEEIPMPRFSTVSQESATLRGKTFSLVEAIAFIKKNAKAKFDETVEAHVRLGIDPKRGDQSVRVAVFAEGAAAQEALDAGADIVGGDDLIAQVKESGGKLEFDKCIATPALMPRLGQVARILGPRGLMPNPKVGSVTMAVGEAVRAAKHGKVDFRADKSGIVHAGIGKVSFGEEALVENVAAFAAALLAAKPAGLKRSSRFTGYFRSISLASTMGCGVRVNVQSVAAAADYLVKQG